MDEYVLNSNIFIFTSRWYTILSAFSIGTEIKII